MTCWTSGSLQRRFHPTLVLAQLLAVHAAGVEGTRFHPTLVLAQPVPTGGGSIVNGFHPTLVLAQQPLLQELYRITGGKVKSSCENRIQISRAGQSTFSLSPSRERSELSMLLSRVL